MDARRPDTLPGVTARTPPTAPLTVAVVSWNTKGLLADCMRSLEPDARAGRADVWVVDNASSDGSAAMVQQEFPWVTLRALDENLGFGPAVNLVARESRADWIAPANSDLRIHPGAVERLLARGEADPRIAAVGPRLVLPDGSVQASVQPFPTTGNAVLLHSRLHKLSRAVGDRLYLTPRWRHEAAPVDWVTGAFVIVRRSAFDAVGGFDERHWMYAEDMDLCWRLRQAGWTVWHEPGAVVDHVESAAAAAAFGAGLEDRWITATYAWSARRRGLLRTRLTAAVNMAEAGARYAVFGALAARRGGQWLHRRDVAAAGMRTHRLGLMRRKALVGYR